MRERHRTSAASGAEIDRRNHVLDVILALIGLALSSSTTDTTTLLRV